jgi:hypothetical protein
MGGVPRAATAAATAATTNAPTVIFASRVGAVVARARVKRLGQPSSSVAVAMRTLNQRSLISMTSHSLQCSSNNPRQPRRTASPSSASSRSA